MTVELPPTWGCTSLKELCEPVEKVTPQQTPDWEFDYLDIASIDNSKLKIVEPKQYRGKEAPSRARQLVRSGDILFSTVRTYLKNIAIVEEKHDGQVASTGFCVLRPGRRLLSKFLFYYVGTNSFLNPLNEVQRGTSYPAVRNDDVLSQTIPLPPLDEQQRIVARIEELFTQLDAGVAALEAVRAQVRRYRQAVLQAAMSGNLTHEWISQQGQVNIQDIEFEKIADELKIPNHWCWVFLEKVANCIDPQPSHRTPPEELNGVPYIGIGDIDANGRIKFETARKVSPQVLVEHKARYSLRNGDFIFGKIGTLGKPAKLYPQFDYTLSANVVLIQPNHLYVDPNFVFFYASSVFVEKFLRRESRATTQAAFGIQRVRLLPFPLPPMDEQIEIVEEVERRFSLAEQAEKSIDQSLRQAARLRQSILSRAFAGKL